MFARRVPILGRDQVGSDVLVRVFEERTNAVTQLFAAPRSAKAATVSPRNN